MNNVTISRETFQTLLSLAKAAQTSFQDRLDNAQKHANSSPNSEHWKDSVTFWQVQLQQASDVYHKALEESIYS